MKAFAEVFSKSTYICVISLWRIWVHVSLLPNWPGLPSSLCSFLILYFAQPPNWVSC